MESPKRGVIIRARASCVVRRAWRASAARRAARCDASSAIAWPPVGGDKAPYPLGFRIIRTVCVRVLCDGFYGGVDGMAIHILGPGWALYV